MLSQKKEIKQLFDLAEIERTREELRQKAANNEIIEAEKKAKMLEYVLEHLDVSAFIAVHATDYFPENGILKPSGHFTFSFLDKFISNNSKKVIQDLQLKAPRLTVHFTLNYVVEGVAAHGQYFQWNTKYAVLIPLKDFVQRVICLNPVDTWIIGELSLPSSAEILMPEKEYTFAAKKWDALAGKAKITPYPKKYSLKEAIVIRIQQRGYHVTQGGDHGWFEGIDIQYLERFIRKSAFLSEQEKERLLALAITSGFTHWAQVFDAVAKNKQVKQGKHFGTLWREMEIFSEQLYGIIFNPTYEHDIPTAEMIRPFSLEHKSIPQLKGTAESYINKVQKEIISERYKSKEEIQSLHFLIAELVKIAQWLEEIIMQAEKYKTLTWGEFLKKQKLI